MQHLSSPFSLILFGASGNLAHLYLYPALYVLALKQRLPAQYAVVGYARTAMDDASFRAFVEASIRADMGEVNEDALHALLAHCHYHRGAYDSAEDFAALQQRLTHLEGTAPHTRVAYLSVPPTAYDSILHLLCKSGVRQTKERPPAGDSSPSHGDGTQAGFRCIVEKPVGHDLPTFERIRAILTDCFAEEEIYLLDHYLGKEAVRNIYYLRYANPIVERLLKNTLIRHVEITGSERLGLEGRAGYFEAAGTLRDYVQSHMLLMASLLTMRLRESEVTFRESRAHALAHLYLPPARTLDDVIVQGQYTGGRVGEESEVGYRQEPGVAEDSRTNTFIALKLLTRSARWEGVPFYLRTGKRLRRRETRISILFQESHPVGAGSAPNRLDIILQGEAGMRLHLQTKIGGTEPAFRPLIMTDPLVCTGDCLPEHGLLLFEAIRGKRQWFLSFDEVRAAWQLIDPLQSHLDDPRTPLHLYPAGSHGPAEADAWIKREGVEWME